MKTIGNYIHGKVVQGNASDYIAVHDPSTGEEITSVILSNSDDFDEVIKLAREHRPKLIICGGS